MSQFKKFKEFAEAKEKGFADKNGLVPNQDIPKADKGPDLMKLKSEKPLGGKDYKGQMTTNPVKGTKEDPLPYKGHTKNDQDKRQGLLVHDDGDLKAGFAFKGNKTFTAKNAAPLGEEPSLKNVQKVKSKGKMSEGAALDVFNAQKSGDPGMQDAEPHFKKFNMHTKIALQRSLDKKDGALKDAKDAIKKQKMTSEEFIKETKDLSPEEFLRFFVEGSDEPLPTVTDLYGNEFTPDPSQVIQYMAALMVKNPRLMSRFVREMKRHDTGMNMMMDEHFSHPEFYTQLAEGMAKPEEGRKRCHRIGRAMNDQYMTALEKFMFENVNEEVQPKADLAFEDGGPMGAPPQNPSGMAPPKKAMGGPFGGGGAGMGDPQMGPQPGGAMGGGGPPNAPVPPAPGGGAGPPSAGGPDMGGMGGGGGMPPGMPGMPPGGQPGMPGMPPGGGPGGPPGLDMGMGGQPNTPMPKFKGETAHGNMIEEMGGFPHMFSAMADYCINCKDKDKDKKK